MAQKELQAVDDPLGVDEQTLKELKITDEIPPMLKLGFLNDQLDTLKHEVWRERVNVVHARRLQQSDVEALRLKGNTNMSEHKNSVIRLTEGIVMITKMIEQLRAKYPELNSAE